MPTNQELDVPRHNYHTTVHHIANNFANYEGHNILELAFLCQYVQARDLPTIVNSPDLPARIEKIKASPGFDPVKSFEKFYRNIGPELRPAIIFGISSSPLILSRLLLTMTQKEQSTLQRRVFPTQIERDGSLHVTSP